MRSLRLALPFTLALLALAPTEAAAQSFFLGGLGAGLEKLAADVNATTTSILAASVTAGVISLDAILMNDLWHGRPRRGIAIAGIALSSAYMAAGALIIVSNDTYRKSWLTSAGSTAMGGAIITLGAGSLALSIVALLRSNLGDTRALRVAEGFLPWVSTGQNGTAGGVRYAAVW